MSLTDTLMRFKEQFAWDPQIENPAALGRYARTVVYGMGGSHLGAWLIKRYGGKPDIFIHRDYGLADEAPAVFEEDALHVLSSYSGTTEEVLDAAQEVLRRGLPAAAVSTGGTLLEIAREKGMPCIQIPETGLEPRMAIGFSMLALARILGDAPLEAAIREGGESVDPGEGKDAGASLGKKLEGKIPVVWSSAANLPLAFIWKIKFNETAKIPAFCNAMPELCHNELTGMDVVDATRPLADAVHIVMLEDESDHPRIRRRMQVAREMLGERGISVERVALAGNGFAKAFSGALLADWASLHLAEHYGVPNPETPLIAEFKKRIAH